MSVKLRLWGSSVGAVWAGDRAIPAVCGHVVDHVLLTIATIALFPTSWTLNKETLTDGATHRLQNTKALPQQLGINHTPLTLSLRLNSSNKQAIFSTKIDYPISNSFKASSKITTTNHFEILILHYLNTDFFLFSHYYFVIFIFEALERVAQSKRPLSFSQTPFICSLFFT